MTTTKSPVSTCGVKMVFAFPRNKLAAFTATWPSTWPFASITHHLRETSLALAEKVFIRAEKARKLRDVPRSVKFPPKICLCHLEHSGLIRHFSKSQSRLAIFSAQA